MWLLVNARFSLNLARAVPSSASGSTETSYMCLALRIGLAERSQAEHADDGGEGKEHAAPVSNLARRPKRAGISEFTAVTPTGD